MELEGRKILVYGTGKSGIGAADLLAVKGAFPLLYDEKADRSEAEVRGMLHSPEKCSFVFGELPDETIGGLDGAVLSPGVPLENEGVRRLLAAGVSCIGEVELAYLSGRGKVYAITGTNGKTTTTALLGSIFAAHTADSYTVGNIGIPYTSVAAKTDDDSMIALEVSSFQLETIDTFHPHGSAILNITEDHLNRHHTMEEYARVKELVTKNQDRNDFTVLNYEDERLREFGQEIAERTQVVWFSSARKVPGGIWLEDGKLVADLPCKKGEVLAVSELQIIGTHNYENAMAAIAMALMAGIPEETVVRASRAFTAVPHRIEFVREVNGVRYYNDSKGTNPDAAIKGIKAMAWPTLLIGGGYDKGSDYKPWIQAFDGKVRYLVLEGVTAEAIRADALACGFPEEKIVMRKTMAEALAFCIENAREGEAVLLSPACASWGEFKNYEQRGETFKEIVRGI